MSRVYAVEMVGKKYGHLTVLAVTSARAKWGRVKIRVRCDCGKIYITPSDHIIQRTTRCRECSQKDNSTKERSGKSVVLPSGRSLAGVAMAAGLKLNTVYVRWLRGWPEKELTLPVVTSRRPRSA